MLTFTSYLILVLAASTAPEVAQAHHQVQSPGPTGTISGRVTVEGKPAPRIHIVLEPVGFPGSDTILQKTITNNGGHYRLTGIPEGRFRVRPVAHPFVISDGPGWEGMSTKSSSILGVVGLIISVGRDEIIENLDFTLTRGGVITGRVIDAKGQPVIEAAVFCHPLRSHTSPYRQLSWLTDDRGIYRIYGLPAGSYLVSVSVFSARGKPYRQTFYPSVTDQSHATVVQVSAGNEVPDINIQLGLPEDAYNISGRVVHAITGQLIPGVSLIYYVKTVTGDISQGQLLTDSNGNFEVQNGVSGRYAFEVSATSVRSSKEAFYSDPVVIEVGSSDITDVEVKAYPGASMSGVIVIGNTEDTATSSSLAELDLIASWLLPKGAGATTLGAPVSDQVWAAIDAHGNFRFTGLRPPKIKISPSSFPEGYRFLRIERDGIPIDSEIDISAGEHITGVRIVLSYGTGSIRGQIKVSGGILPPTTMWKVRLLRIGREEVAVDLSDAKGHFWIKGLEAGEYELVADMLNIEHQQITPTSPSSTIKRKVSVLNNRETEVSLILDLGGRGKGDN